ncbi:MAG: mechanosensitive ion channel family protein [Bacillota bacterium]|uniref:Mechanosensitive ion channel family protein n=1 Tax=Virgibacillus salarius TaxID=447199 RepID=A0A941DZ54_9BACI|nr:MULTISPECIES: mechanosensitive ion channel family protein [Bacillaceae]NAZ09553.1 mechanosensitive ion channel [Agaribacter marinus]MBR7796843.1 mechanosensitive ion channel family protein [Virgibacillus salarius]MCC2252650.1 mechanosensitive ion channel family protein [Virgibacillus sp. AGTR]MDY7046660.1 mechanosensitive ion channel family protein [Virgibacillus sp. M23]QRZ18983.1 mechanosensitive ion channel family protein [Virgibacillus sp. AGTR]
MKWLENIEWEEVILDVGIILIQLVAILIAFLITRAIGKKLIQSSFSKVQTKKKMSVGRTQTLQALAISFFSYVLIFITLVIVLGIFGINAAGLIAGAGIIGLAIGFGAQGLVSDVVTGFFLLLEKQLDVGDYVTTAGYGGIVEEVGLRTTQIRSFDGTLNFIPNREISSLSNHSRGNMRALVDIGISYDDNIDHAMTVLQEVCDKIKQENETIVEGPDVLGVQTIGDSDITLRVIAKTENMEQWAVERQLRKAIKEAFDQNNIDIPFPHQVYIEKQA